MSRWSVTRAVYSADVYQHFASGCQVHQLTIAAALNRQDSSLRQLQLYHLATPGVICLDEYCASKAYRRVLYR